MQGPGVVLRSLATLARTHMRIGPAIAVFEDTSCAAEINVCQRSVRRHHEAGFVTIAPARGR